MNRPPKDASAYEDSPSLGRPSRRSFLTAGSAVLGASLLAACTSGASPGSSSKAPAGPKAGKLTYWYAPPDTQPKTRAAFIKYNITAFEDQYPNIKLTGVAKSASTIDQNIQVALAAHSGPDIIPTPGPSNAIPYASAGYLADLGSYYTQYNWKDKLLPWAQQVGTVGGKNLTIPQYYETLVLYYNKTLFTQRGWTPPTNRGELETLAAQIASEGVIPFAAGNSDYPAGTEWLVTAFWNNHAGPHTIYKGLTGELPWTDPAFVAPIELLKSYFDKGWFAGGAKRYFSNSDTKKFADFASGEAAMYLSGTWEFVSLPTYFGAKGNTSEFDWVPIPSLNDGVPSDLFTLSIGGTLSINSATRDAAAAATYLDWVLSDTKNMWAEVAAMGLPPTPIKFNEADVPSSVDPRYARVYTSLQKSTAAGHVGYTTWTFWGGKADTHITGNIDKVLTGNLSASDFCAGVDAAFKSDKQRGLIPTAVAPTG